MNRKSPAARGIPQPFNWQAGPVYRPQAESKPVQLKMANGVVNRKLPVAPPVYRPQPVPKVLQTKSALAQGPHAVRTPRHPVAPPVYRPEQKLIAQPKMASAAQARPVLRRPPVSRPQSMVCFPGGIVQRAEKQRGGGGKGGNDGGGRDVAAHNWDNVLAQYRNGQAAKEVIDAFEAAGYYGGAQRAAILKAMNSDKWGKKVIAHSLGGNDSGLRAGTDKRIQDCKTKLIAWAKQNRGPSESKSGAGSASGKGSRRVAADDEMDERVYISTIQMASWAKKGDRGSMTTLANWATGGNELAWDKLVEMARSGIDNAVNELSRLATQGNDRAWEIVLREFQIHRSGSSGGALPVGYTPHPPVDMQALWKGQIRINHDPWEHVQGVDPAEWDE